MDKFFWMDLSWSQAKNLVEHATSFSNDALHVLVGVVLQILLATLLRTSIAQLRPWILLLLLALANECYDLAVETWPDQVIQRGEGAKDVLLTMALPTLLMVLARYAPSLFKSAEEVPGCEK